MKNVKFILSLLLPLLCIKGQAANASNAQPNIVIENSCPYQVTVTFKRDVVETFSLEPEGHKKNRLGTDYNKRPFEFKNESGKVMKYFLSNGTFLIDTTGLRGKYEPNPEKYFIKWNDQDLTASKIVQEAEKWKDAKYEWGGNDPHTGVDCSGLTKYVYKAAVGVTLPRTADGQWKNGPGKVIKKTQDLVPGDLIFFSANTGSKKATHVGIYIGNNKVISAQSGKTMKVKESPIDIFGDVLGGRHIE